MNRELISIRYVFPLVPLNGMIMSSSVNMFPPITVSTPKGEHIKVWIIVYLRVIYITILAMSQDIE